MSKKTSESLQVVDQFAETAHGLIDRLRERALDMEADFEKRQKEGSEAVVAGMERQVSMIEKMIEENPMVSAMVAFGFGAFATRVFKAKSGAWSKTESAEAKPKAGVKKAA